MPIQAVCACGKRFNVKEEHAGKRGKCPGCGAAVVIPAPPVQQARPRQPSLPEETTEKTKPASSKKGLVFAGAGAGIVLLAAAVWAGFHFFGGDPEQGAQQPKGDDQIVAQRPKSPEDAEPDRTGK